MTSRSIEFDHDIDIDEYDHGISTHMSARLYLRCIGHAHACNILTLYTHLILFGFRCGATLQKDTHARSVAVLCGTNKRSLAVLCLFKNIKQELRSRTTAMPNKLKCFIIYNNLMQTQQREFFWNLYTSLAG